MKSILLVNPTYEMETLRVTDEEHIDVKADNMPLGLATVAALTPGGYRVDIWDEFVRGPVEQSEQLRKCAYDLVGVTSSRVTILRARDIAEFFRRQGTLIAIGGPGVSGSPDRCREYFDILFIGEAELTWPRFLLDWKNGGYRQEYRQIEKPDISLSPMPKWDSIAAEAQKYSMGSVQTTRGCPYDCEFCDVIYLNGRRQRHKSVERVLDEVRVLQRLGMSTVYFADDNLIGNHQYAKELLRKLIAMNNAFEKPLRFATQASIDVSRDEELLGLMADANFYEMLIGIESPNKESLKEIGKYNNLKGDLVEEVHKILSYGMSVRGALIGGLDHDGPDIFDQHFEFIQKAYLPSVSLHMLNAPIGTRLWRRLREEGRVIDIFSITDKVTRRIISNVIPKQMTRIELMQGFRGLYARVFSWESFKERMIGFVSLASRAPNIRQEPVSMDDLMKLGASLGLDSAACGAMNDIFRYTAGKAPFLLERVKQLVIQFVRYSKSARDLIPKLEKQIELESSGSLIFQLDSRPMTVPKGFREAYQNIFPDTYRRVYLNLTDKKKVSQALMEVFVEFLVHEEQFSSLEEHHVPLLLEIVDRTCARFNDQKLEDYVPVDSADATVPDSRALRLGEDVLNSVEQELLKLVQA
ncbi:MAG: B12-binding domain-containing radical SAM protein [Nitrospirae bacterium]|nr:B12-binding domain-containing radical SAM protein [Nitrospirota bacterium]